MIHWRLFLAFFKVGILGYGGGPSSIPLVHKEVVERYKWMSNDEFSDMLALGNTLPGPIATKIAGYIGYRMAGILGMLNAVAATIVPTIVLIIVLLTSLTSFKDQPWVAGMTRAVVPVVGVMLAVLTWGFLYHSKKETGWALTVGLTIGSFVLLELLGIHPGIVIAILLVGALIKPTANERQDKRQKGDGV